MLSWHQMNDGLTWVCANKIYNGKMPLSRNSKSTLSSLRYLSLADSLLSNRSTIIFTQIPDLHDPFLSRDAARCRPDYPGDQEQENILIYGDNDVDGMTGTALLTEIFAIDRRQCFYYVLLTRLFTPESYRRSARICLQKSV